AGGLLTGKYKPGQEAPAGSRAVDPKSKHYIEGRVSDQELLERVQRLQPLADEVGLSLAQLSVAWVLQKPERVHGHHRGLSPRSGARQREGRRGGPRLRSARQDRRDPR